jgi:hypothetical protein
MPMLGYADLESQAIAYQSLVIRPAPKLKLFQLGKELKVKSREESKDRKPTKFKQEVQSVKCMELDEMMAVIACYSPFPSSKL